MVNGQEIIGYCDEPGVASNSITETYAALKLHIDNWRWADVPFYLRTGKALAQRVTVVNIQFRQPPLMLFAQVEHPGYEGITTLEPNVLTLRIQPDEGITLKMGSKLPGPAIQVEPVRLNFSYREAFGVESPEAYERLLLDCMLADSTLFTRSDEVENSWRLITQILEGWARLSPERIPTYPAGSWGPEEADAFIARDGRSWIQPTDL